MKCDDRFLRGVARQLARRRKAIRYQGKLEVEHSKDDEDEKLTIICWEFNRSYNQPTVELIAMARNRVSLCVRSDHRKDRGRTLLRIGEMFVPDNPKLLIKLFEWTFFTASEYQQDDERDRAVSRSIEEAWQKFSMRPVESA